MLDLKVGDKVIEESSTTGRIYNVVRLTKTLAVLSGGRRMSLNKGYEFGGSASWPRSFRLATPAEVMTWDERQKLQNASSDKLTINQLRQIVAFHKEDK